VARQGHCLLALKPQLRCGSMKKVKKQDLDCSGPASYPRCPQAIKTSAPVVSQFGIEFLCLGLAGAQLRTAHPAVPGLGADLDAAMPARFKASGH
jgi:hypothetical protein